MNQRYIVFPLLALLLGLAAIQRGEAQLLTVTTDSLDLGEVRIGSIATALDTLQALQGSILIDNWNWIYNTGRFQLVGPRPGSVGDTTGSSAVISIGFTPIASGTVVDILRITYHSKQKPKSDTLTIFLKGTGVLAPSFERKSGDSLKEIDFGSHPPGTPTDTVIFLRNNDKGTSLKIVGQSIQNDRGTFTLPDPVQLAPINPNSLSDTIRLQFTPLVAGDYSGAYIVTTSIGAETLVLKGRGVDAGLDSLLLPPAIDFGTRERGTCDTLRFTISNHDKLPIVIDTASIVGGGSQGPFYLVTQLKSTTLKPGDSLSITVQYCPPRQSQQNCDTGTLRLMSGTSSRDMVLRGCGAVRSIVIAPDTTLDFGDVDVGSFRDRSYTISNPGPLPVNVSAQTVSTANDFDFTPTQQLSFRLDSGDVRKMFLRFEPQPTTYGRVWDTLAIASDAVNGPVKLVLVGNVPPVWQVATAIDFGDVYIGRDSVIDVSITNISSTDAQVQTAILENPFGKVGFDVTPKSVLNVPPGESRTLTIRFTPTDMGDVQDKLAINNAGTSSYAAITLTGRGISDTLVADTTLVRFDPVALGGSVEASFIVRNDGNVTATLDPGTIEPAGKSAFQVIRPQGPIQIAPSAMDTVTLQFKPTAPGPDTAKWVSGNLNVMLYATAAYRIWFETAFGKAGDRIPLELKIEPPLRSQTITGFTAELSVEPMALFAETISNNCSMVRDSSGRITITTSTKGTVVSDSVLAIITFRGLSTGQPDNVVSLDAFSFTPALPVELESGRIYLSGCDIGRTALAARRAKISALKATPGSDQAELTYSAAEGASVAVRVVGIDGQLLREQMLPDGTGNDQTAVLPLAELPPGLVFVELRVVNDRSTIPLMIMR
jgi:hypothetical protein